MEERKMLQSKVSKRIITAMLLEVSAFGIDIEGDYVIEDGEITITYNLLGLKYDMVKSFERKGSSIFIDGTEFVKEK